MVPSSDRRKPILGAPPSTVKLMSASETEIPSPRALRYASFSVQ
jgi:hypothetical protein